MAQIPFRGNLQSMSFPLLSKLAGRSVVISGQDQVFVPQVTTDGQVPIDKGLPTVVYAHNVMPSTYGWQSVGYTTIYSAPNSLEAALFESIEYVQCAEVPLSGEPAPTGAKVYVALGDVPADDKSYLYVSNPTTGQFERVTTAVGFPGGGTVAFPIKATLTTATLNGITYICVSNFGTFLYNDVTGDLIYRDLKTLDRTKIIGITGSNGFMLAWTDVSVAWSSTVDIEDFEPSDVSGAGGGNLQEAAGPIIIGLPTIHGVIFFTEGNAVSATYTGNDDFPWTFKGIAGTGGITSSKQVSHRLVSGYFYAYTTYGIQQVMHTSSKTVFPHISDFIAGGVCEDYDSLTDAFTKTELTVALPKQLVGISDRYVVVSYGGSYGQPFTHAVVLDIAQSRMGKLRITHTGVFEQRDITFSSVDSPRDTIAMLLPSGECKTVDFTFTAAAYDSVLMLGKFQLTRTNLMTIEELEVENTSIGSNFTCTLLSSQDGKSLGTPSTGYILREGDDFKHFLLNAVGVNHTVVLKGTFNIISYVLWGSIHGRI